MKNAMGVLLTAVATGLLVAWLAGPSLAATPADDAKVVDRGNNLVEVVVTGAGMTKEEAKRDAKRKAIERGAGAFIYSKSEVKDFALVRDTVIARAAGFVQSEEEISVKQLDDETWAVKLKVVVSVKGIEDMWGTVQTLLKDMGRPKIMVFIREKADEKVAEDSTVETKIEDLLLKNGFALVDKKQITAIQKKDLASAIAEDKPDKALAIAKGFGAQIFITGSADAVLGDNGPANGVKLYRYGAKGNITCFNSDTGDKLASKNDRTDGLRPGVDRMPNVAADKALAMLADKLGPQVRDEILRVWLDVFTGGGSLKLEVDGIAYGRVEALTEALKKIKDVTEVPDPEFANKVATFNIQAKMPAKELAKRVGKIETLDITDVSQNVIKATYKDEKK